MLGRRLRRIALLSLFGGVLSASACGRAHTLGVTGGAGGSGGGAAGGTAGGSAVSAGGAGGAGGADAPAPVGAGGADAGPPKPTRLTIVNGVNDYDAIRLCFLPYPDGDPAMMPWPSAPGGLSFARAAVVDPIAAAVPPGKDVRAAVLAGDLSLVDGKTCDEALALAQPGSGGAGGADAGGSPPSVVAAFLPVLPAAAFDSHKSVLLAPYGCLGPGHEGPSAALACGAGYDPGKPALGLVALGMARKTVPERVLFQVVNASAALPPSDVRLVSGSYNGPQWKLASALAAGAIAPAAPFDKIAAADLGPVLDVTVKTYAPGKMFEDSSTSLYEGISGGSVAESDVRDGAALVLVGVGAAPGVAAGPFWHELTFALIQSDP